MSVIVKPSTVTGAYFTDVYDWSEEPPEGENRAMFKGVRVSLGSDLGDDDYQQEHQLELDRRCTTDWPLGKKAWIVITDDPHVVDLICGNDL